MTEVVPEVPVVPPATTAPPVVPEATPAQEKPETDWKAEARKHEARAKENAGAAAKLAAIEEASKTESQRLSDRAEAAEKRAAVLELSAMRSTVALEHGLPADLVDRLRGDTAEALAEDAKNLMALLKSARPAADIDQGARGGGMSSPEQLKQSDLARMSPAEIVKAQAEGRCNDLLGIKR